MQTLCTRVILPLLYAALLSVVSLLSRADLSEATTPAPKIDVTLQTTLLGKTAFTQHATESSDPPEIDDVSLQHFQDLKRYSNGLTPKLMKLLDDPTRGEETESPLPFTKLKFPMIEMSSNANGVEQLELSDNGSEDVVEILRSIVNQPSRLLMQPESLRGYDSNVQSSVLQYAPARQASSLKRQLEKNGGGQPPQLLSDSVKIKGTRSTIGRGARPRSIACDSCPLSYNQRSLQPIDHYQLGNSEPLLECPQSYNPVTQPNPCKVIQNEPAARIEKEIELPGGLGTITERDVDEFVDSLLLKAKLNKQKMQSHPSLPATSGVACHLCEGIMASQQKQASNFPSPPIIVTDGSGSQYFTDGDGKSVRMNDSPLANPDGTPSLQPPNTRKFVKSAVQSPTTAGRLASNTQNGVAWNPRSRFYYQLSGAASVPSLVPSTAGQETPKGAENTIAPLLYHVNELRSGKPTVISLDPSTAENFLRIVNTKGPALQVVEIPYEEEVEEVDGDDNGIKETGKTNPVS